jgi:DNA-binding transcriptional ArsR family regulator
MERMLSVAVDTVAVYKALGDEVRLGMVQKIAASSEPVASCTIVSSCSSLLKLAQPTVSHHFAKLVDAGVLEEEKVGTQKLYRVNTDVLRAAGVNVEQLLQS